MCESTPSFEVVISLANLSTCVNSAANFLVYMLRGKKFRDLFLDTYCCCRWASHAYLTEILLVWQKQSITKIVLTNQ